MYKMKHFREEQQVTIDNYYVPTVVIMSQKPINKAD